MAVPTQSTPTVSAPITQTPELDLSLSDTELIELVERKLTEYRSLYETGSTKSSKDSISDRAAKNVSYWRGTQTQDSRLGKPLKRYRNNIIHRDLATRVQNATSRMPDVVVMSPQQDENPQVKEQTRKVESWLNIRIDSDVTRRLAQAAVRDNHLKFRGIWKYRYDTFRKDAIIERLRPEDVVLDATARIPEDGYTADNMEFIGEWMEDYTSSVLALFPDKATEITDELSREARAKGKPSASKIRYLQSTARVSAKDGTPQLILINSYNKILLSKGPHPYWDEREGSKQQFGLIPEAELHPDIAGILPSLGLELPKPKKPQRFNHFPYPRMPYSIFSGENLGDGPLDDTTVVEQSLALQDIVNERGDQITQTNDWAVPKTVVATSAMTAEKTNNITRDASEVITVKLGEGQRVTDVITTFTGQQASPALYQDLQQSIQAIDSHFSTSASVRGESVEPESGVSKQISREGNLSASDDIAQTMVQRCVEEAANWLVQLAKIYFDEPNAAMAPGSDSSLKTASISSELIPDNIQIVVKANAVDKMTLRNLAMNLVSSKAIAPFDLFTILDFPNPKEMTQGLLDFLGGGANGYAKYMLDVGINPAEPANKQSESTNTPEQTAAQAASQGMPPAPAMPPEGMPPAPQGMPPEGAPPQ